MRGWVFLERCLSLAISFFSVIIFFLCLHLIHTQFPFPESPKRRYGQNALLVSGIPLSPDPLFPSWSSLRQLLLLFVSSFVRGNFQSWKWTSPELLKGDVLALLPALKVFSSL